jgi:hypothetical protein
MPDATCDMSCLYLASFMSHTWPGGVLSGGHGYQVASDCQLARVTHAWSLLSYPLRLWFSILQASRP